MSGIIGGTAQNLNVRNNVYDDNPGVLAWVPETQPLIKTDTLSVDSDVTDRAGRLLGVISGTVAVTGVATSANQVTTNNHLATINAFTPSLYDTVNLTYTDGDLTGVVFKLGIATVSTLTLTYTAHILQGVVKS